MGNFYSAKGHFDIYKIILGPDKNYPLKKIACDIWSNI